MYSIIFSVIALAATVVAHIKLSDLHTRTKPSIERQLKSRLNTAKSNMRKDDVQVTQ